MTAAADLGSASGVQEDRGRLRSLIIYPIVLLAALGVLILWLSQADLTETELVTLAPGPLLNATLEHLRLTAIATVIVLVIAIPLGILLTRRPMRRWTGVILAIVNIGQAAPAVGLIVLFAMWMGFGSTAAIVALVVYAVLPVLRNTMVGLDSVDQSLVEAGRGMGMSALSVLWRIELPLAVPLMLAGIRTALVLVVGTATLATFVSAGGLGVAITTGVNLDLPRVLIAGSVLVSLLALAIDWLGRVVEHIARPRGL
ncbi:ABC transporter permease [Kocuria sp. p3-SID1433]|uniref:ABC transporter permease n=1 Tax=unclassified Kocuria TaxID=2649579 RepID=UPI0021A62049|nr:MULTISPECIES: ABC transporter permease [unclassified Kocuria]MCT1602910.1 ABC transporter permease [Kocuria sp. p3-SID1428]MCT2179941.1 ABC transporter permease [Kocuria sp. p3-SID1433]